MGYDNFEKDYNYYRNSQNFNDNNDVVSIGAWIGILILMAIPIINIIGLLIMAFSNGNTNIKNFAKASLLIIAIPLSIAVLLRGCS